MTAADASRDDARAPSDHEPVEAGLGPMLDRLLELSEAERVSVGDAADAFGRQGFLPVMMAPALIIVSPLSGVPILPSLAAIVIFLTALQMTIGRRRLWLPGWLRRRSVRGHRLGQGVSQIRGLADWLDRHSGERLAPLVSRPGRKVLQVTCTVFGLVMPLLELIPFSSSLLALAVVLMGLAMLTRDGLWAAIGILPAVGAVVLIGTILI